MTKLGDSVEKRSVRSNKSHKHMKHKTKQDIKRDHLVKIKKKFNLIANEFYDLKYEQEYEHHLLRKLMRSSDGLEKRVSENMQKCKHLLNKEIIPIRDDANLDTTEGEGDGGRKLRREEGKQKLIRQEQCLIKLETHQNVTIGNGKTVIQKQSNQNDKKGDGTDQITMAKCKRNSDITMGRQMGRRQTHRVPPLRRSLQSPLPLNIKSTQQPMNSARKSQQMQSPRKMQSSQAIQKHSLSPFVAGLTIAMLLSIILFTF